MKRLVLCCDGTWNSADQQRDGAPCPTNVVKLAYRIAKRDAGIPQVIYYDQGVGTGNAVDRLSGGALGQGLEDNIHDAYRFLVANYEPGDELYFFGFSRGAFTARSIVGMIRKCGILGREHVQHYHDAITLYRSDQHPDDPDPVALRKRYSLCGAEEIPVTCIGVWDTVGSLGIPLRGLRGLTRGKYQFHDTQLSGTVRHAYHALAVDEHRAPFEPTLWTYKPKPGQVVEQVWFCGAHSDVGGGYPEFALSDITLGWMLEKARGAGLALDRSALETHEIRASALGPMHNSKVGLYRMTPGIDRTIGIAKTDAGASSDARDSVDPTQSLHETVRERWDGDATYRPENVRAYFKRTGDPRGATR
jgi:uncharacterized protein (DUF2235 family)